jgi:hypothetical protein
MLHAAIGGAGTQHGCCCCCTVSSCAAAAAVAEIAQLLFAWCLLTERSALRYSLEAVAQHQQQWQALALLVRARRRLGGLHAAQAPRNDTNTSSRLLKCSNDVVIMLQGGGLAGGRLLLWVAKCLLQVMAAVTPDRHSIRSFVRSDLH